MGRCFQHDKIGTDKTFILFFTIQFYSKNLLLMTVHLQMTDYSCWWWSRWPPICRWQPSCSLLSVKYMKNNYTRCFNELFSDRRWVKRAKAVGQQQISGYLNVMNICYTSWGNTFENPCLHNFWCNEHHFKWIYPFYPFSLIEDPIQKPFHL